MTNYFMDTEFIEDELRDLGGSSMTERQRATVEVIGTVTESGVPTGFVLNGRGIAYAHEQLPDGSWLRGGWSDDELRQMARDRDDQMSSET